jgi:hypothetical protein
MIAAMKLKIIHKLIFTLLILITISASAQDLLLTTSNDSIQCKIIEIKQNDSIEYIYFKGGIKKTEKLNLNSFLKIVPNFYLVKSQNKVDSIINNQNTKYFQKLKEKSYFKDNYFRISVDYIYSSKLREATLLVYNGQTRLLEDLKNQFTELYGYQVEFSLPLNKEKSLFLGILASNLTNEFKNYQIQTSSNASDLYNASNQISNIGVKGMYLFQSKRAYNNLYLILGMNKVYYKEEFYATNLYFINTSNTYTTFGGFNYDFRFHKNLAIGIGVIFETGFLKDVQSNESGKIVNYTLLGNGYDLLRLNYSTGLKYYLSK